MPDKIDLSPEDEKALDAAWAGNRPRRPRGGRSERPALSKKTRPRRPLQVAQGRRRCVRDCFPWANRLTRRSDGGEAKAHLTAHGGTRDRPWWSGIRHFGPRGAGPASGGPFNQRSLDGDLLGGRATHRRIRAEGEAGAEYGEGLLKRLADDLAARHGRGFSRAQSPTDPGLLPRLADLPEAVWYPQGAGVPHNSPRLRDFGNSADTVCRIPIKGGQCVSAIAQETP